MTSPQKISNTKVPGFLKSNQGDFLLLQKGRTAL